MVYKDKYLLLGLKYIQDDNFIEKLTGKKKKRHTGLHWFLPILISPETYQILLLVVSKKNRLYFLLAQTPVNLMVDRDLR